MPFLNVAATLPAVTVAPTTPAAPTTEASCNLCEGAPSISPCPCSSDRWWDGEQCTTRVQCPCYVGHIP